MIKKWILVAAVLIAAIYTIPYTLPIVFALLTAIMLENAVKWFMVRFKWVRFRAVLVTFLLYLLFIALLIWFFVNLVINQIVTLAEKGPSFANDFYESFLKHFVKTFEQYFKTLPPDVVKSFEQTLENTLQSVTNMFQSLLEGLFGLATSIPVFLIEFLVYSIAVFLFSLELSRLKYKAERHLKESTKEKLYLITGQLNKAGVGFIKAQIFLSIVTFLMAFVGLLILNVPYAVLLSIVIVFVDILPILGTGSILVPWAVVSFFQGNQFLGFGLIVLFIIITVVRRILEPKVFSTNMGISPLAALVSLFIGFKLLGFIGFFLGPAVVIVYDTLREAGIIKSKWKI
ncbi:sporulation integral membrane protein YtvI [Bacillus ectoiniformans]|uniref:sporulation integral membrane protein YtvI n=1 Tax=Bacillus ectoiniformans TaxID=1494429 RepID=UPI00195B164E|nr:sporulation integral membrane protein YtvI [Bacillus ectoiniformans]MBM7649178.1 sporulation integral membrane protein YtvI [Bacillus ectoiniformans]